MRGGAGLIASVMAAGLLLAACGQDELAEAYKRGWAHGAEIVSEQPTEQRAYKYCDQALVEVNEAPPVINPVESAYWTGCLNGTEGVWDHLPESELQSLVEDP